MYMSVREEHAENNSYFQEKQHLGGGSRQNWGSWGEFQGVNFFQNFTKQKQTLPN